MKILGSAIRAGNVVEIDGRIWRVVKHNIVSPGKGGAFNQIEIRDVKTGTKSNMKFRSDETVEQLRVEEKELQYLFKDGDHFTFMDQESYEQVTVDRDMIGDPAEFLTDGMMATMQFIEGQVVGVELRQDMVDLCNAGARKLGLDGLVFECGDVRQYPFGHFDVMVALHACDIATDHALHMGIRSGARIVMCSPCCHKEVRPQLKMPQVLRPLLQHGVHLGQEAEMLTDGLRALLLESRGYTTQVFEFVQLEHTSKNKMILGVRKPEAQVKSAQEVLADIQALKQFYGVRQQTLESLLQGGADVPAA